jgi:formate hydrogenlyase subunit 3/multisubunit Na+/H+ antiporter MnhD subunit
LAFAGVLFFAMGIILVLRRGAAKRLIRYRSIENVKLR